MFSLNEKVVYPGYGVAQVSRIIEKNVGGCSMKFYELILLSTKITVLIPIDSLAETGIRKISSTEQIEGIFKILEAPVDKRTIETVTSNWSKKNKAYQCALRTGELGQVCKIYRELVSISSQKELSFGEKTLLHKTEGLLVEEIAIVTDTSEDLARNRLRNTAQRTRYVQHMP